MVERLARIVKRDKLVKLCLILGLKAEHGHALSIVTQELGHLRVLQLSRVVELVISVEDVLDEDISLGLTELSLGSISNGLLDKISLTEHTVLSVDLSSETSDVLLNLVLCLLDSVKSSLDLIGRLSKSLQDSVNLIVVHVHVGGLVLGSRVSIPVTVISS